MIPIIDIFAGPGGLGEGFSSWTDQQGRKRFALAASFEKDPSAHATLRLRAFRRLFSADDLPPEYERLLRGESSWDGLRRLFPRETAKAEDEAHLVTLGQENAQSVRALIKGALRDNEKWVLVGGPPCQAYSLVGRARNKGIATYRPELDHRQTLYVEYLQVLADHAPPVFVMENVKGLLSATVNDLGIFDRIREDLCDPAAALKREGRPVGSRRPRYEIRSLVLAPDSPDDDPAGYVVRSEFFGIPQRRHRVILIGIRDRSTTRTMRSLTACSGKQSVVSAIGDLPRIRSGLSKQPDSNAEWLNALKALRGRSWIKQTDSEVRSRIQSTLAAVSAPALGRGREVLNTRRGGILNHTSRGHIVADLERYLFASSYGAVHGTSPKLGDFPKELLPAHANVERALASGLFADRFRVQIGNEPSTTVTSHISKDGHYYIHPDSSQCRSLTVREAARLQTFDDDYFFCGPRTAQYHQVGNAVPPKLARQIAGLVADLLGP